MEETQLIKTENVKQQMDKVLENVRKTQHQGVTLFSIADVIERLTVCSAAQSEIMAKNCGPIVTEKTVMISVDGEPQCAMCDSKTMLYVITSARTFAALGMNPESKQNKRKRP